MLSLLLPFYDHYAIVNTYLQHGITTLYGGYAVLPPYMVDMLDYGRSNGLCVRNLFSGERMVNSCIEFEAFLQPATLQPA